MDRKDRGVAHDLANALLLKSESRGSGSSRFITIYKTRRTSAVCRTSRTLRYIERSISKMEKFSSEARTDNNHLRKSWDGKGANQRNRTGRSPKNRAAAYRDGDIVGASAPEIGADNKGRAMLEKMGWSAGTALGPVDNKGILQPVAHVVKKSRAGLGS
jgi:G-patch domain